MHTLNSPYHTILIQLHDFFVHAGHIQEIDEEEEEEMVVIPKITAKERRREARRIKFGDQQTSQTEQK